jgi:hypothetical protein
LAETKPGVTDVKLLFARSSNRCAFPQCVAQLAHGNILIGEVCHIKGAKPGSARYDPQQSPAERHGYANLLIMCPTHHSVIDSDRESYTVERLLKIKVDHEAAATPISEEQATAVSQSFTSGTIVNIAQSGGIAAQNFHANNVTLNAAPNMNAEAVKRRVEAIDTLWSIACDLRHEFSDLMLVESVLLPQEIDAHFRGQQKISIVTNIESYANDRTFLEKYKRTKAEQMERQRPFVSHRLWAITFVLRAVHGRLAYLYQNSITKGSYLDWRTDSGMDQLLRSCLASPIVEDVKGQNINGFRTAIEHLENLFLTESGAMTDGGV